MNVLVYYFFYVFELINWFMFKYILYSNENKYLVLIKKNLFVFCDIKFYLFIFLWYIFCENCKL